MHSTFGEALARSTGRLEAAAKSAAASPHATAAWCELADAAREIEADSLLAGEFRLAYVATKIDAAVSALLQRPLPPPADRVQEIRELVATFEAARGEWRERQ